MNTVTGAVSKIMIQGVVISLVVSLCSGCASIVSKSHYPVTINSTPPGATVTIKDKRGKEIHKAVTPATITLRSGAGYFSPAKYSLNYEKEGYEKAVSSLSAGFDGWYVGNIVFGGLIGLLIVDPATGAMWRLGPSTDCILVPESDSGVADTTPPSEAIEIETDREITEVTALDSGESIIEESTMTDVELVPPPNTDEDQTPQKS